MTSRPTNRSPTLTEHLRAAADGGSPLASDLVAVLQACRGRGASGARDRARGAHERAGILDVTATDYHQRTPLYIGSAEEVAWAERCHRETRG